MADTFVMFDPTADPGSMFKSTAVQEEIGRIAPANAEAGSITADMLAAGAVETAAIANGAVGSEQLASEGVETANIANGAVGSAQIANNAVGPTQAGTGIVTATDTNGNPQKLNMITLSSAAFALITTPDPNTLYFLTG